MACCCVIGCTGGVCTGTCYACTASGITCADAFCGGCLSGASPLVAACSPCAPACVPDPGQTVPLCSLPITNAAACGVAKNLACNSLCQPVTSPCSHGATDQPPHTGACNPNMPKSGGSGSGSALQSAGGRPQSRPVSSPQTNLLQALLNKLGTLTGSVTQPGRTVTGGRITPRRTVTNSAFLLTILVVGALAFLLLSGRGES